MVSPPPIQLATLGWEDSLILMVLALVVFGPRRLPLIGRQIGKLMYEFRKASNDFKFQMEEELRAAEEADRRKKEEQERQRAAALASQSQASVSAPGQTIEAQADVGAAEAPTAGSEPYPPESPISSSEPAPTIQPPRTGEQVSGSAPFSATEGEVNPEADAEADAAEIEARAAGIEAQAAAPASNGAVSSAPLPGHPDQPNGQDPSLGSPKEPVGQHG